MSKYEATTCKCVKSKCLKLYCECYRQGITCNDDCVCIDCKNTKEYASRKPKKREEEEAAWMEEPEVVEASNMSRARVKGAWTKEDGCACKNSRCLKKYCFCFNAGFECNAGRCKCYKCENPLGAISAEHSAAARLAAQELKENKNKKSRSLGVSFNENTTNSTVPAPPPKEDVKCSCTRTNCLKLYCDCFRQDLVCNSNCGCLECENTEEESGPTGARTKAKEEIMKRNPLIFMTPKKKSGGGCSCTRNKCITKYCDCNARGVGCDPAICSCINCENMMKPHSEMMEDEFHVDDEDSTEVFIPEELDTRYKRGLENFSHRIDDFTEREGIPDPSQKVRVAYINQQSATEAASAVIHEETEVQNGLEQEIKKLEKQLADKIKQENDALDKYRKATNKVMCLEMKEPCRWNSTYQKLKEYVMKTGDLPPVPSACTNEADRKLSIWVQEMKSLVYSKSERITNFPHRIEALESLGVEWIESSEDHWNKMYERLAMYKRQNNTVRLPSFMQCRKSKDKDLAALRHWVDSQEQDVKSGEIAQRRDRLRKLQQLGLPFKLGWEQEWDYYIVELLKFRSKHGHMILAGSASNTELGAFVEELLKRLKRVGDRKLSRKEIDDLRLRGLLSDLEKLTKMPLGRPPRDAGDPQQPPKIIPLEKVKEVNVWAGMLEQLKAYLAEHGNLDIPNPGPGGQRRSGKYDHLHDWVQIQRRSFKNKTLEESRVKELRMLGLEFDPWENMFLKLKKYKKEGGTCRLPKTHTKIDGSAKWDTDDKELAELCNWLTHQIRLYRKDQLEDDHKKKLRKLGVKLTKSNMGKVSWEERFEEMIAYHRANKTCLPKRDGPLRKWVLELVDLIQNGYVSNRRQQLIDESKIVKHLQPEVIFNESPKKKRKMQTERGSDGRYSKMPKLEGDVEFDA